MVRSVERLVQARDPEYGRHRMLGADDVERSARLLADAFADQQAREATRIHERESGKIGSHDRVPGTDEGRDPLGELVPAGEVKIPGRFDDRFRAAHMRRQREDRGTASYAHLKSCKESADRRGHARLGSQELRHPLSTLGDGGRNNGPDHFRRAPVVDAMAPAGPQELDESHTATVVDINRWEEVSGPRG